MARKPAKTPWVVMKFGGTSVSTPQSWETIEMLVRRCLKKGRRPLVVHSALSKVSNLLEAAIAAALNGNATEILADIAGRHADLAGAMGLDGRALIASSMERLANWLEGIGKTGEASPRLRARILAEGEIMATAIGAARLRQAGLDMALFDAREGLRSVAQPRAGAAQSYLGARGDENKDAGLDQRLVALGKDGVLTQGFIAANAKGETVLLGRGGSDVSAALFAAKLRAERLEIWTDVPGMFSADPRLTASARLLRDLSYEEAHEIALMGARVMHPRALPPLRRAAIAVQVRCTMQPQAPGTRISAAPADTSARVKAVAVRNGLVLVSMTTTAMWGEAGFLAKAFAAFASHGLSIDLVSTSEASVTVSLDPGQGGDETALEALREQLAPLCRVSVLRHCASVSLVGRNIRAILHKLTPALALFREHPVRLVSQAANDLNFTVVVDEDQAMKLARRLHDEMVEVEPGDKVFGPPWQESAASAPSLSGPARTPWWVQRRQDLLAIKPRQSAAYVYDLATVRTRAKGLQDLRHAGRIFYAMKANAHPAILKTVTGAGPGLECVSLGELDHALQSVPGLPPERLLFTPNFAPRHEYAAALARGVHLTLDNLHPLQHWPELFRDVPLLLRIDPGQSRGHHRHVQTAGAQAKFGIPLDDLAEARDLAAKAGARITGLHAHAGSGILDAGHWHELGLMMAALAKDFADVRVLNLGGGLGVPDQAGAPGLDLAALDTALEAVRCANPALELWLEPGRFVVAEAGVLLARVTQIKSKAERLYAGLETGMNSLIRPALYGAHHDMVNLSRLGQGQGGQRPVSIVGPVCESADLLGRDRMMPPPQEGDVILIANTGAYGAVMASSYNLRAPAQELVLPG